MRQSKAEQFHRYFQNMERHGINSDDAAKLRRIEMTLHRWAELECGDGNEYASWAIERDEKTDKPYMVTHYYGIRGGAGEGGRVSRSRIADHEAGALRRLQRIMAAYPELTYYHQTDPRGCALYIVRRADIPTDWFDVVAVNGHFTIQRRGSDRPYSCEFATIAEASEFAARQTLDSFYTRGLAACI